MRGGGGEKEPRKREPLSGDLLGQKRFSVFALRDLGPRHASFTHPHPSIILRRSRKRTNSYFKLIFAMHSIHTVKALASSSFLSRRTEAYTAGFLPCAQS